MSQKSQPKPIRRSAFLEAWKKSFNLEMLSDKGIQTLLNLKEEYDVSYENIQELTGMPKSSLQRRDKNPLGAKNKTGPKSKLTADDKEFIFEKLTDMRTEKKVVQISDFQRYADIIVGIPNDSIKNSKHYISPSTASRLLKANKWKYRRSQNRLIESEPKERNIYIANFLKKVQLIISFLKLTKDQLYIMDESGIHTDLARKYTFTPQDDKTVYIKVPNDSTKDTVIVTLTASGGGHLYFVPYSPQSSTHKAVKGVGKEQMFEWCRSFIGRTRKETGLLLLDNLNSHKAENVIEYLRQNDIIALPFPVRCADKLSVLDNSFLRAYKANLSLLFVELSDLKGDELKTRKKQIIFDEFDSEVNDGGIKAYFDNIGYSEMFQDCDDDSIIKQGFVPNAKEDINLNTYEIDISKRDKKEYSQYVSDEVPIYAQPDIPVIKCRNPDFYRALISLLYAFFIIPKFRNIWNEANQEEEEDPIGLIKLLNDMSTTESKTFSIDSFIKSQINTSYLNHSGDLIDVTDFLFNSLNIAFDLIEYETIQGLPHAKEIKRVGYIIVPQEESIYLSLISYFFRLNEESKNFYKSLCYEQFL